MAASNAGAREGNAREPATEKGNCFAGRRDREEVQICRVDRFGRMRANQKRGTGFPHVQRIGEPPSIALGGGEADFPT